MAGALSKSGSCGYLSGMQKSVHGAGGWVSLHNRSVLQVSGPDRVRFLQGLITADVESLGEGEGRFAALLSPQGKILFDFFISADGDSFLMDVASEFAPLLQKRLTFYKLRARVEIEDRSSEVSVAAVWSEATALDSSEIVIGYKDPRLPAMGSRCFVTSRTEKAFLAGDADAYETIRIENALPEAGRDYPPGDTFPHDACLDLLGGIDFHKGCYVGQEVVSRMQHRGTGRTRVLSVSAEQALPDGGVAITAGGFPVGRLGSASGNRGIALARLDRVCDAIEAGTPLIAGDAAVTLTPPSWAPYTLDPGPPV